MKLHWWWFAVAAFVLLTGGQKEQQWMVALLAALGIIWALTTHALLAIVLAIAVAIVMWTAAAWKYLRSPTGQPTNRS